jgi:hypothetical protein
MGLSRRKFTKEIKLAAIQTLEIDFLKGCLQRLEEQRMLQALTGKPRSIATSKTRSKRSAYSGACE